MAVKTASVPTVEQTVPTFSNEFFVTSKFNEIHFWNIQLMKWFLRSWIQRQGLPSCIYLLADIFSCVPQRHPENTRLRLNHEPATMARAYIHCAHRAAVGELRWIQRPSTGYGVRSSSAWSSLKYCIKERTLNCFSYVHFLTMCPTTGNGRL